MTDLLTSLKFKRAAWILIFAIILAGSSVPGQNIPSVFQLTPDKLIHCLEYFVLGLMIIRWVDGEFASLSFNKMILVTLLIGGTCGMLDELYQHLIPNRSPDFYDWCLDITGVALSTLFFNYWKRKISTKNE